MQHEMPKSTVDAESRQIVSRYAWVVFGLTFGLLLSDYMSRQVLNAVFPMLKSDWHLSDTELGSLVSIVALIVGVLTIPLSLMADALGRARSLVVMALVWNVATLACGFSSNYGELFAARLFVGVGAAAYGSVGAALLMGVFPPSMRSTVNGSFLAGSVFGSVFGLALGGLLASRYGWRGAFDVMAVFGIALACVYYFVVPERRITHSSVEAGKRDGEQFSLQGLSKLARELMTTPSLVCAFVGGGLQLLVLGAYIAWMPSYLNRAYAMSAHDSAVAGSVFVFVSGVGMVLGGIVVDFASKEHASRKMWLAGLFCLTTTALLGLSYLLSSGPLQLGLIAAALLVSGGATGPAGAVGADVSRASVHATVMALGALAFNLLGFAPGPLVTGMIADHAGLEFALGVVPLAGLFACAAFWFGARKYDRDVLRPAQASGGLAHPVSPDRP